MADLNVQVTTQASLSDEMKVFYDTALLRNAEPNLVHAQFGKKVSIPKNRGKIAEFRKFSSFPKATTPLVEGVTPDGTPLEVKAITAECKQYGDYSAISDVLDMTAVDDIVLEASELHGDNAGLTIDTITRNELQTGTHVIYAPTVVAGVETPVTNRRGLDATAKITGRLVNKAATFLKKSNTKKINGDFIGIIHPSVTEDLRNDPSWLAAHEYAKPDEIYSGEVGKLHGVRFVESTEAKVFWGEDLASDARSLLSNGAIAASQNYITFDGGTVAENALQGRWIIVGTEKYYVISNTDTKIYIGDINKEETTISTLADNTPIYPGEGGKDGCAVYGCLFLGKDAYGVIDIGAGLEMIVKQLGSGGTSDPLNQRSTVGWKHPAYTTKILNEDWIVRLEVGSSYSDIDTAN